MMDACGVILTSGLHSTAEPSVCYYQCCLLTQVLEYVTDLLPLLV